VNTVVWLAAVWEGASRDLQEGGAVATVKQVADLLYPGEEERARSFEQAFGPAAHGLVGCAYQALFRTKQAAERLGWRLRSEKDVLCSEEDAWTVGGVGAALRSVYSDQNPHMLSMLLATGTADICEVAPAGQEPSCWNCQVDETTGRVLRGGNWTGKLLMRRRAELLRGS
jgi:hypothetical protein